MRVEKVLEAIMAREGLSYAQVSQRLGMKRTYVATALKQRTMKFETVEKICNACGYDLSVKAICRADGFEFDLYD